jgi:hypothetical protein
MSRRSWIAGLTVFVLCGVFSSVALGASPHFTKQGVPTCEDTGTSLACSGELVGLGNADLVISLRSDAVATFLCGAPGNNNVAAGQNKVPFTASGSQTIPGSAIKNGRASFNVFAPTTPPTATPEQAGCPNPNWHVIRANDIDFANINLTISQGGVLLFTCTYPGEVPEGGSVTLSCQ